MEPNRSADAKNANTTVRKKKLPKPEEEKLPEGGRSRAAMAARPRIITSAPSQQTNQEGEDGGRGGAQRWRWVR